MSDAIDLDELRSLRTPLIVYVGPELSRAAGLPSRRELARRLVDALPEETTDQRRLELAGLAEAPDLADAFTELERDLTAARFGREVERALRDDGLEPALARSRARGARSARAGHHHAEPRSSPRARVRFALGHVCAPEHGAAAARRVAAQAQRYAARARELGVHSRAARSRAATRSCVCAGPAGVLCQQTHVVRGHPGRRHDLRRAAGAGL